MKNERTEFTAEQLAKLARRIGADIETWLRDRTLEPHYDVAAIAAALGVAERTVWGYVELYESSKGREGLGPVVKLSHKVVRISASTINRFLRSRTIDAAALVKPAAAELEEVRT